jgi:hypothetical protein
MPRSDCFPSAAIATAQEEMKHFVDFTLKLSQSLLPSEKFSRDLFIFHHFTFHMLFAEMISF